MALLYLYLSWQVRKALMGILQDVAIRAAPESLEWRLIQVVAIVVDLIFFWWAAKVLHLL